MDIKVYDQKLKDLQSHIPFLKDFIAMTKASANQGQFLTKLEKLYEMTISPNKLKLETIIKIEKAVLQLKQKYKSKTNERIDGVAIKREDLSDKTSVSESISETPDSPSPTRHYERTSPIEIPTERSDVVKIVKKEKYDKYRCDDDRRYRSDRHETHDKSDRSRYDGGDRYRSRYDQHERSKSRDRFKRDRRDRSDSSDRSRHGKGDRYRYEHSDKYRARHDRGKEKYDPFENRDTWKHDERGDRGNSSGYKNENKYERSDKNSLAARDNTKMVVNPISESSNSVFNRLGMRPQSTIAKVSNDDKLTEVEASEIIAFQSKLFGEDSDNEGSLELKNLIEVRTKLVTQIKIEKEKRKENKPSTAAVATSSELPISELNKISLTNPIPKTGLKFKLDYLKREATVKDSTPSKECTSTLPTERITEKEDSANFSFLKTFQQTSKSAQKYPGLSVKSKGQQSIDDDIINKLATQSINEKNNVSSLTEKGVSAILQNLPDPSLMDIVKQALATTKMIEEGKKNSAEQALVANKMIEEDKKNAAVAKALSDGKPWNDDSERLANKYNPKVRADQHPSDKVMEVSHSNNLQLVHVTDPRISRVRDPRVQAQQDSVRKGFSPPPAPPSAFITNYPPTIQSVQNYNKNPYQKPCLLPTPIIANPFPSHPGQQHPYPSNIPTQYPIQSHPNVPNYNIQRNLNIHRQVSPVSSTDVSPRYQYQPPYPDHNRNPLVVHNKFRPSLNDKVERQKYEQSRSRPPMTYGEYKRSQAVSSTSEKLNNETVTNASSTDLSKSHHDNLYRSRNYSATPTLLVTSSNPDSGQKFRIPKKKPNDAVKTNEIHATEHEDSRVEYEDEPSNVREVRDSDDSGSEISGNGKGAMNSDSEVSESRDPRIRVNALKTKSALDGKNVKDSPQTEKQNDVVTSSTSLLPDNQSNVTKEDMESMLKQLINPNNLLALLTLCGQVSDDNMFSKIKDILKRSNEANETVPVEESTEKQPSPSTEVEKNVVPKTPRKKQRNELEKLNEDIRTMFISDGVLTATGRRMCAAYKGVNKESKEPVKNPRVTRKLDNRSNDDVAVIKPASEEIPATGARIMRRRNTTFCYTEPSGKSIRPPPAREEVRSPSPDLVAAAQESKPAKKPTKIAKSTKTIEPSSKSDEPVAQAPKTPKKSAKATEIVERITRSRVTRECNIVLEKLHPTASVESLNSSVSPKKDGRGKRVRNEVNDVQKEAKKKRLSSKKYNVKNNNPEWHSLNKTMDCQLCEKPAGVSLVSHHVNCHPDYEVFPCRVPPDVADFLRNSNETHKVERIVQPRKICHEFKQRCYFCNDTKCFNKMFWLNHISVHTGYYQYKCTECDRRFAVSSPHHVCNGGVRNKVVKIPIPQFNEVDVYGYLCDLCNYVRLDESQMEKHLRSEHEGNVAKKYKKVIFFRFPKKKKKSEIESKIDDSLESSDCDMKQEDIDTVAENKSRKRTKSVTNLNDDNELPDHSTEKILRSRVIHSEPFIADPKEDDGLFDRDTMKLMKDMSFSASKDAECSTRTNRTKSIADKLSERFNSVQEDDQIISQDEAQTVAESLNPLTCDEGIPIVIKMQTDDDYPMEENSVKETNQVTAKTTTSSTTTASVRENNSTPTEEFFDESDDNWESYSSDASEDDSEDDRVSISRPSNKKNVGIIDTIARLQQSISSQGATVQVDGVDKFAETASQSGDKVTVKEERNNETTRATTSERQVDVVSPVIHSEGETPNDSTFNVGISDKSGVDDDKNKVRDAAVSSIPNIDKEDKPDEVLTYEAIVNEATQAEDGDAKTCVSNGRSSLGNYSFNLSTANKESKLGSRNGNLGASSSNADSNNDVEMDNPNCQTKVLTRIYNIGYTSSSSSGSCITFCCLIEQCGFESNNDDLYALLSHIEVHSVAWSGYCHACNAQVCNKDSMMMEFKHMTHEHLNKKDEEDSGKATDQKRMPLIKCKVLPGDKLSKSKEAEIDAKTKQLSIQDSTPSTSSSAVGENNFIKITNVKSLTTTAIKADSSHIVISNVVSLGASRKDYDDSEIVILKRWVKNPTLKLQKYCKKMMRDISLFALYKCMAIKCSFTTNDTENMLNHLRNHENNVISQIDNPSDADTASWLECAYCDEIGDSCLLLVKHIQNEHQSSIFQCPYCFYRSCVVYNVIVHLKQFHQSEPKSVLVCHGKPKGYATEKALIEKSRQEFVRPLRCTEDCKKITYVMDYFVQHMKSSSAHSDKFKCQVCGFAVPITETAKHLVCHRIGVFECVYCQYGTNDVESIQNHMCNVHPSKLLYICVRLTRKSQVLTDVQLSSLESTLIVFLGQFVDSKLFQRCPYNEQQLSFMSPSLEVNSNISESAVMSVPVKRTEPSSTSLAPIDIEITAVASISSETFSSVETLGSPSSGLMLNGILSYKDFEKEYVSDDYDKYFASLTLPDQSSTSKSKRRSSTVQAAAELPENTAKPPTTSASRSDLLQGEIDNAAYNLVKGTGLEGSDLYRCCSEKCEEKSTDILAFNVHLLKHNDSQKGFKCYHCTMVSKNIVGLKYHIKVHGIHRYFCYFCNHTSAIVNDIQKHMQDTHSRTHVNSIALNPKKVDQNKDMFVVCPRGLRQDDLNRFGFSLIDRNKRKLATTKKFYSPDDIELLPLQPIFNDFIWCSLCDYSTKVRTNMQRHLSAHKDTGTQIVPKIDPVNPVPCLDTGEKHFDKMINLACSSNDGKNMQCDPAAFVPEGRRFVCNARQCRYQTISENMLKRHLTTLHTTENQYKCPHCNTLICQSMDADKVIFHLRMHDAKLYKCPKCTLVHHVKSIVEKHKEEAHVGCSDQIILVTRDDTTSSPLTDSPDGQPKVSKWKCALCNDLCATQKQIQAHVQTAHCIKFQYQCDICNEVQSNNKATIQEHMSLKHPNVDSRVKVYYTKVECSENDNTPIWRRDDPNKVKHIRGILFEEEHVRKSATKKDQTEVKKKTSKKKDKPVDTDPPVVHTIHESESDSLDDNESNTILIISDEDMETAGTSSSTNSKVTSLNAVPSTSKNLIESGKRSLGSNSNTLTKASDEPYACGRCFKFSNNSYSLVKAHQTTAHPNVVCDVLIRNDLKGQPSLPDLIVCKPKEKPKFTDSINYICFHCIFKSQNPQIVYKHWKENHKFPKITTKNIEFPGRPFMFRILKIYQCFHCRCRTAFNDLKGHSLRKHPSKTFAMIDNMDPKKCGICSHKFDDYEKEIEQHFKEHINQGMSEPINYLTDEFLDQVIAVLPKDQVKCIHCNIIFFSVTELESHTKEKHTGIEMEYETLPNDPIMYGCSKCSKTTSSETAMIEHIREHLIEYQCKFCARKFSHLEMVKQHHEIMHKVKDQTYRNIDVEQNLDKYLKMKIIFPNGLVLTKGEAKYTKYGSTNEIIKLVTELNSKDLEAVKQRQQNEKHAGEAVSGVKKFLKVRKRVLVSSDNDDDSEPTSDVKPTTKLRKRRKINDQKSDSDTDVVSSIRSHQSIMESTSPVAPNIVKKESGTPSSEDEPLKNLIPYTFYGQQSKPVNLSKVFTHMQISGSNIRVSCDRFALLVNMNPKLRIKRCTDP